MTHLPLVSILTPSFNQAGWLQDNLDSVRNQTYPSVEHIVMDGGSTDRTREVLESTGATVTWRSEPDNGQSHALNKAYRLSKGEIIGWLNSDDAYVDRRAIQMAVDVFRKHPEVGVVFGHGLLVTQTNVAMQFIWAPSFAQRVLNVLTPYVQPSVFIRRSALGESLVNESLQYVMDLDLWLRLAPSTRFKRVNIVVGLDRNQPQRKSLAPAMSREIADHEQARGRDPDGRAIKLSRKLLKVGFRIAGLPGAMRMPSRIDPAITLEYRPAGRRMQYQIATRRANMSQE